MYICHECCSVLSGVSVTYVQGATRRLQLYMYCRQPFKIKSRVKS